MTIAERNNKLKHYITCLKCEVSGKQCDDNCSTQYEAGNMGDHDCSLCPMNTNINRGYPKKPEYRCLLAMMEDKLRAIKALKEGE